MKNGKLNRLGRKEFLLALAIVLTTSTFIFYKVEVLGYTMAKLRPEKGYFVRLVMEVGASSQDVSIDMPLPIDNDRQRITQEKQNAGGLQYSINRNREARWFGRNLDGTYRITYSFFAKTDAKEYAVLPGLGIRSNYPPAMRIYLESSERIQARDPEIVSKARELMPEGMPLADALKNTFEYVYKGLKYENVRGPTDAVSALRLGEASCNGKNRLLVALLRARGIPARVCKGLILQNTQKRTSHAWTEVLVGDKWVPFCPTSGSYARIPENYLELGKDDRPLFTHSKHIQFDWQWIVQPQENHKDQAAWSNISNPLNIINYWVRMKDVHVPLRLIMLILLVPIAGTVICIFRNIFGLVGFGTFMPALIAVAFQETGFFLGSLFFLLMLIMASAFNTCLVRFRLLHIPRLTIVLTFVVIGLVVISIICVNSGLLRGATVTLFPIAILTLTTERFTQTILEDSWKEAAKRLLITYLTASACFLMIGASSLQLLVLAFPELLLLNIAINLLIGSWSGLRISEYFRFRALFQPATKTGGVA